MKIEGVATAMISEYPFNTNKVYMICTPLKYETSITLTQLFGRSWSNSNILLSSIISVHSKMFLLINHRIYTTQSWFGLKRVSNLQSIIYWRTYVEASNDHNKWRVNAISSKHIIFVLSLPGICYTVMSIISLESFRLEWRQPSSHLTILTSGQEGLGGVSIDIHNRKKFLYKYCTYHDKYIKLIYTIKAI